MEKRENRGGVEYCLTIVIRFFFTIVIRFVCWDSGGGIHMNLASACVA